MNGNFLGNWGQQLVPDPRVRTFVRVFSLIARICLSDSLFTSTASISRPAYPVASTHITYPWFRNINRISIDYAFRPRLRYRLTLRRLT